MSKESICAEKSMRINASCQERRGLLPSFLFSWAKLYIGFREITLGTELFQWMQVADTGGLWYLWTSECFLKELSAFSFRKRILLLVFQAKMLKHHLEYSTIRKCHLLFWPLVCTALHYLTRLYFSTFFRRSHVNLPQETGKFKNKDPPRLFNAKAPSVAQEIHKSWMHRCWESVLDKYHCKCTLAILLFSRYLLVAGDRIRV